MTQTKITKSFQTRISAEAIRRLKLRPGQRLNQIVEGNRLILEPVGDAEALAGSLGHGKWVHSTEQFREAGRKPALRTGATGREAAI
jgi:bifunctional DNA-binding transcriptional regulator/antitoxin component of YhaV-PrlF toxin-antitoxin module